jgi:flagellar biosynthesis protein FlhG
LSQDERVRLAEQMQSISERYDVLFFDTGAGISENVVFFNALADEILLVTTPDPTAVTDTYALTKILTSKDSMGNLILVVNQVETITQGAMVHERLNSVCQNFLGINLKYGGALLKDSALEKAVRERKPVLLARPEAAINQGFRTLAARFDELFVSAPRRKQGEVWKSWLNR